MPVRMNGYVMPDEQVRSIKLDLVRGVTVSALSRMHNCSEGTISRIRRGLTYRHVVVPGEEGLRPALEVQPRAHEVRAVMGTMTEEEEEVAVAESLRRLTRVEGKGAEVPAEVAEQAKGFWGQTDGGV